MFSAINKATGEYTLARDANKDEEYVDSLANGQRVFPVQGEVKKFHYRYDKSVPDSERLTEFCNESETHETVKQFLYNKLLEYNATINIRMEFRYRFGRIADIGGYTKNGAFAIEIVHQHTNYQDYQEKRQEYYDHAINDVWVFTGEVFDFKKGYGRFLPILEDCQNRYGKILYCENNTLKALIMLRKHSDTYRAYDITSPRMGYNINTLLNLENNYKYSYSYIKYYQEIQAVTELEKSIKKFEETIKFKSDKVKYMEEEIKALEKKIRLKGDRITILKADKTLKYDYDDKGFEFPLKTEVTCKYLEMCIHPYYKHRVPFLKIFIPSIGWKTIYLKAYHENLKSAFRNAKRGDEFKITRMNDSEINEYGYRSTINYLIKKRGIHYD